jgi:hypothetical protein
MQIIKRSKQVALLFRKELKKPKPILIKADFLVYEEGLMCFLLPRNFVDDCGGAGRVKTGELAVFDSGAQVFDF